MQDLPPGWRVTNVSGSHAGPPPVPAEEDNHTSDGSDEGDDEDTDIQPDSPGWEDTNPDDDVENLDVKCLLCDMTHPTAPQSLEHCKQAHGFDLAAHVMQYKLDFYGAIKLVNYTRSTKSSVLNDPALWADEKYLQPVLENDALLFSLDEVIDFGEHTEAESGGAADNMAIDSRG